ncbi:acyltransferase family protein [Asinibacterium sp. OR53]|uniref:acyltransferase family protein n=1 Tax=Asinibacterium sp. OR53 TaxID=925409 RepID=UPI00047EA32B|nr:hypothetical protein [Asinibacterium sp. OR53]
MPNVLPNHSSTNKNPLSGRLLSLDALRGFDMFWIVSGEGIFHGIASAIMKQHGLVQNAETEQIQVNDTLNGIEKIFVGISNQLVHTVWNGFTFYDLIFPLFIFIAGVSMHYSFSNQLQKAGINQAAARKNIYRSLIKRTLILILLGMVVNRALEWNGYANTRFASVLGRIALSCFFAALIYLNNSLRRQIYWLCGLLLGYWAMMSWIPVPGYGAGVLTPEGSLASYIDRLLLPGRLYRVVTDPEGLLSTIPAIGTAMLGMFTGGFLRSEKWTAQNKALRLLVAGILLILTALLWNLAFPINKKLWTSSFVCYTGGWSLLLLSLFYFIIDVCGYQKWCMPFVWMGTNSILIYMAVHGLVNFEYSSRFLFGGLIKMAPAPYSQALVWTGVALIQFTVLYFLYRKKWFLKL